MGISKAHVFNLEKGITANPSMDLVVKLAELFRVRVADLVAKIRVRTISRPRWSRCSAI